jgi:hypothetical protein
MVEVYNTWRVERRLSMGFLKRLAFYLGLLLGLVTIAAAGTVAMIYLFTGKFPSVELSEGKPEVALLTPDEVVAVVRSQVDKARAAAQPAGTAGGENDGGA